MLELTDHLNNTTQNDVFTLAFFAIALMLASVWRNFLIVFLHKTRELMFSKDWRTFDAENANQGSRLRLFLSIIHLSVISIYLYQIIRFIAGRELSFWLIFLALISLHVFRILVTKMIEKLFAMRGVYEIWIESYSWIHFMLGVLFFPMAVFMTYSPLVTFTMSMYIGVALFILGEILLIYRLFVVFYQGFWSLFYLFLYLCTLEILPLLTMFRLLSQHFS